MKKFLLLSIVGCLFASCKAPKVISAQKDSIVLKFVQINDVYEIAPLNGGEHGGLARVAFIRDSIKAKFPNTFLFLAGDFLNPSLLGTIKVDGERLNGKQMVEVLNAMNMDMVTFGNHEFDLEEKDLQKRLDESQFDWTSANVLHVTENGNVPFNYNKNGNEVPVSEYAVYTTENAKGEPIKFGVFGVTLPSNPKDYVYYGNIYESADRAYDLARQDADFVVGLTHVALGQDKEIAKRIPSLPLIMGGHEHFNMLEKEGITIITKADANAKTVYVHTLIYNPSNKTLNLDSQLVSVNEKTGSSPKVEAVVEKWTKILDSKLREVIDNPDQVVYHASIPLDGTDDASRGQQTNLGNILAHSMAQAYKGKVSGAFVNGGSIRIDDKLFGDISSTDIFRILPFGGSVLKVELKGKLLNDILDYGLASAGTGAYLQRYNISKGANGKWEINGAEIQDNANYSVAVSDFLLKGLDIPFLTPENPGIVSIYYPKESETAADIRKAIISLLTADDK